MYSEASTAQILSELGKIEAGADYTLTLHVWVLVIDSGSRAKVKVEQQEKPTSVHLLTIVMGASQGSSPELTQSVALYLLGIVFICHTARCTLRQSNLARSESNAHRGKRHRK